MLHIDFSLPREYHCILFRGTGVGIDIDGKMKNFLRFPGFETYVPPEKDEEHIEEVLTTAEIQKLEKKEIQYQERKKKRKKKKKIKEKRKRAKKRTENIQNKNFVCLLVN